MRRQARLLWRRVIPLVVAGLAWAASPPPVAAAPDDARRAAMQYLGSGADAYRMGDLAEATRRWGAAIRFCRLAGDRATETDALARRGEALQLLGQLRAAAEDLENAVRGAEALGDAVRTAAVSGALGNVYFQAHDFDRAQPLLARSMEFAERNAVPSVLAASANNLGNLAAVTGDGAGAIRAYDRSIEAARATGDAALVVTATTNKARTLLRQDRDREALQLFEAALQQADALPESSDKAFQLIAIARATQPLADDGATGARASRQALSYEALRRGARLADALHDRRAGSLAYGYLGELYAATGGSGEAGALARRAVFLAQQVDAADLLYRWEWLLGRLARASGDREAAIAAYRRAVSALQAVRQDIPVEYVDGRSSFRQTVGPLYFELADLLLQSSAGQRNDPGAVAGLLREARNTVETLKTAEIRDYFKNQCLAAPEAGRTNLENVAAARRTAALYPIVLPDRVELLLSFPDGRQTQVTSRVDEATLARTVRALRIDLETLGTRDYIEPAQRVYDWLIRPLEPELAARDIATLVVVPDGVLRIVPFAALHDGKEFLAARYAIATVPGLTLVDPKPMARGPALALLSGLSKPVQGYPGLPFVIGELAGLSRLTGGGTVLEDEDFRLARVEQALRSVPYSVVHIASHGEFSSDPQKTFILTYDGRLTLDRLEGVVKYSEFRDQPLELLTLSACRTAAGDDRAALGLAGVAIKAGARSAVASLWFINDEAASRLITLFYERLKAPGASKAQALQQAQLELIKDRRFRHPGYWSPFLVIGNWL